MALARYIDRFARLRVNAAVDHWSPHKPCMLLAVSALAEAGRLAKNRVAFDRTLLESYAQVFDAVCAERDHRNPYFPFFHLQGERFRHLKPRPGREAVLAAMKSARTFADIVDNVAYAYLDEELHALLVRPDARGRAGNRCRTRTREGAFARFPASRHGSARLSLRGIRRAARAARHDGPGRSRSPHSVLGGAGRRPPQRHRTRAHASLGSRPTSHRARAGPHLARLEGARLDYAFLVELAGKPVFVASSARHRPREDALAWRAERLLE